MWSHMTMLMITDVMTMMMVMMFAQELSQQLQISHVETSARFITSQFLQNLSQTPKIIGHTTQAKCINLSWGFVL